MKRILTFSVIVVANFTGYAQTSQPDAGPSWNFSSDLNFYFIPDNFILLPVMKADKNKLHLEARYNYEDIRTFSGWAGYNFSGGNKVEFAITPMVGVVKGNTNGLALGGEFTFIKGKFELYSETEYLFDADATENNFLYTWNDLTYSLSDHWWVGLSAQRTRLYQTKLDIQRGLLAGASWKKFETNAYLYNLGFDTAFALLTVTFNF